MRPFAVNLLQNFTWPITAWLRIYAIHLLFYLPVVQLFDLVSLSEMYVFIVLDFTGLCPLPLMFK